MFGEHGLVTRQSLIRPVVVALLCVASLALGASGAVADARLVSSGPRGGISLTAGPTQVRFVFDAPLVDGDDTISLSYASGDVIASSTVVPVGSSVVLPVPTGIAAATCEAAYCVMSADGTPVEGASTFSVTSAGSASAVPQQGGSPAPRPDVNPRAGDATFPILPVVLMAALALAVLGLIALILGPRARHNRYDDPRHSS